MWKIKTTFLLNDVEINTTKNPHNLFVCSFIGCSITLLNFTNLTSKNMELYASLAVQNNSQCYQKSIALIHKYLKMSRRAWILFMF